VVQVRCTAERVPAQHQEGPFASGLPGHDQHPHHARSVARGITSGTRRGRFYIAVFIFYFDIKHKHCQHWTLHLRKKAEVYPVFNNIATMNFTDV
jgi:hypothetical protein